MSLSILSLAVLLFLLAFNWLGWVAVNVTVLGVVALITAILIILEGLSVFTYKINR